jgi:2-iminobutanoate/2-iminopropanoate deaminase
MTGISSSPKLDLNEQHFRIPGPLDRLPLFLRFLPATRSGAKPRRAVIYVHGATFPSALSIAHRFDGRAWRDALCDAGFDVWGLDFYGFGGSGRYPEMDRPAADHPPLFAGAHPAGAMAGKHRLFARRRRCIGAVIDNPSRRPGPVNGEDMKREVIRVEPLSTYLERWKAPTSAVTRHGDTIYVSGFPPFDPETGEIVDAPIERQTELVLEQLKLCVETAGSSLENVLKCNVYCTSVEKFAAVNAIYARYFPKNPPARIFINVPAWPGHFDIEIDCIAAVL